MDSCKKVEENNLYLQPCWFDVQLSRNCSSGNGY
jgi:hypothetical protein